MKAGRTGQRIIWIMLVVKDGGLLPLFYKLAHIVFYQIYGIFHPQIDTAGKRYGKCNERVTYRITKQRIND